MSDRYIEYMALAEVVRAPRNPKNHAADAIAASVARFGFVESPMIDERTGRLVAGHGRIDELQRAVASGDPPPDGIQVDETGGWRVPVQRGWASRDDAEAEAYLVASNLIPEKGGWDPGDLYELLNDTAAADRSLLEAAGVGPRDLDALLRQARPEPRPGDPDPEDVPSLEETPVSALGDLWQLGPHRLVCGDARDADAVARATGGELVDMVWTDPPYGVAYEGAAGTIENDDLSEADLAALVDAAFKVSRETCRPGAAWFVCSPAGPLGLIFAIPLHEAGILRQGLVWEKDSLVLGHQDYHYRHEAILFGTIPGSPPKRKRQARAYDQRHEQLLYGWVPGAAHRAPQERSWDSVWQVPRPKRSDEHPTMKPVALVDRAIRNHTVIGERILDPFAGAGSALIAAHQAHRVASLVELDPRYVDVIVRRFERFTGVTPVLAERQG